MPEGVSIKTWDGVLGEDALVVSPTIIRGVKWKPI